MVITGGTGGIGLAAAEALAAKGARVTIVARDEERAAAAVEQVGHGCEVAFADLFSMAAVRRLADDLAGRYPVIDVLVNNAGAMFRERALTDEGIERTWALNHLAPFLLTNLLLEGFKRHQPARIIATASEAHRKEHLPLDDLNAECSYRPYGRYGQTKLANISFTAELARRVAGSGVTATCYHPGLVATGFNRNNARRDTWTMRAVRPYSRSPKTGADTLVWLADSDEVAGMGGTYFFDRKPLQPNDEARDAQLARRLWEVSSRQVALSPGSG